MDKKKILHLGILLLFAISSNAQSSNDWGWDWKDSAVVPAKQMEQRSRFLANDYPYPPKPRSQWELGFAGGISNIFGDVKSKIGFGGGFSVRKALGHIVSLRASYFGSFNSGEPSGYGRSIGQLSYKTMTHSGSIDGIVSLNTASNYRGNPKTNIYALAGYTMLASQITIETAAGDRIYYASGVPSSQTGLITTVAGDEHNGRKGWSLMHGFSVGGGIAFKLSDKVNIGLEDKLTFIAPGYDLSDGFVRAGNSNDFYHQLTGRLNINIGKKSSHVQPLWWLNPNNYIYNEVNAPKHMKLPKPVLDDADGDGITDQFDLEPNTPAGAKVDSHGRALDTDGDGIPDFRDKEPLTSQKCFPVNNDGVGTCPEPACCTELRNEVAKLRDSMMAGGYTPGGTCGITDLPSIKFKSGSNKLSKEAQTMLASVAQKINANPTCKVRVIGYGTSTKKAQQNSWERVNAVIKYLVDKQGISESRLIFAYGQEGEADTVDLQATTEDGPNTVPAPHPNLRN
jgi:OOP family OmpA-OmpF porin